jgi:hypothetical protein
LSDLEYITRRLISLAMEKRLMDELRSVAGELPEEVLDDIYRKVYRPVMVTAMKALLTTLQQYLNKASAI